MKLRSMFVIAFLMCIFQVSALTINSVNPNPPQISPGGVSTIEIGLENNGNHNIEDVTVSLDFSSVPFAPELSSSEFNFDEIEDGKIRYATFKIRALNDAESGIYKIPVSISYTEQEEEKKLSSLIGLAINSPPELDASIEEGLLLKDSESTISVKIVNKGLSNVKFLEAELGRSGYYSVTSPDTAYIGDLDSDDFDTAEFKVYFKDSAPSLVNMPITLSYRDALNNEQEKTINLNARVYTTQQALQLGLIQQNYTFVYVIIVVAVIIAYIVYRRIRKSIRKRKEQVG